jgi:hypothetical protein
MLPVQLDLVLLRRGVMLGCSGAVPLPLGCPALPGRFLPSYARPSDGAARDRECRRTRAILEWCGTTSRTLYD